MQAGFNEMARLNSGPVNWHDMEIKRNVVLLQLKKGGVAKAKAVMVDFPPGQPHVVRMTCPFRSNNIVMIARFAKLLEDTS